MADQVLWMNLLLYCFGRRDFTGELMNLNFISMQCYCVRSSHTLPSRRHSVLTFAVSVMLNFVEIKYQGKAESPFETHPKTMLVAVTSVILYCFSYDASLRVSSSTDSDSYVCVVRISLAFFGPLSLASLSSVLFPEQLCPVLFSVFILFSLSEFPCSIMRILWSFVHEFIRIPNLFSTELHQQGRRGGRRRRRQLPDSVYLPSWFSFSEHAIELMDQVDNLPV